MASKSYPLTPRDVRPVQTALRKISGTFPVPESVPLLEKLRTYEPRSMEGQPPVVWDHAEGFQVFDAWGNQWIDFSSGVLITNAGHNRQEIAEAIIATARRGLLTHYCFPGSPRAELAERLVRLTPPEMDKAFILSTGSEAVECALKMARQFGRSIRPDKRVVVSFENAFHGRTLGAQLAGGTPALKEWIGPLDPSYVQVPFPDGYWTTDTSFSLFEKSLADRNIPPDDVCAVLTETYQGGGADFAPPEYIQALRAWCDRHQAALICDEVQAGFGRCGRLWGFEHYGIVPDLITCGKGISSSLPVSAVVGKRAFVDQFAPGSMTSTHTGNPICAAAAVANIDLILREKLVDNAATVGAVLHAELGKVADRHPDVIACVHGKGLVAGMQCVKPGLKEPDGELAWETVAGCVERGLLLFSPVGRAGCSVKICPPLCITEDAVREGVGVIAEALDAALARRSVPK